MLGYKWYHGNVEYELLLVISHPSLRAYRVLKMRESCCEIINPNLPWENLLSIYIYISIVHLWPSKSKKPCWVRLWSRYAQGLRRWSFEVAHFWENLCELKKKCPLLNLADSQEIWVAMTQRKQDGTLKLVSQVQVCGTSFSFKVCFVV